MSNDKSFEPEIVVLYCQRCIRKDADVDVEADRASGFSVQPVMMPCSSKIEVPYILKILERGADAVEVVACPADGCRFLVGSLRAEKRIDYVRGLQLPEIIGFYDLLDFLSAFDLINLDSQILDLTA